MTRKRPSAAEAIRELMALPGAETLAHAVDARFGLKLRPGLRSAAVKACQELVQQGLAVSLADAAERLRVSDDADPLVVALRRAASVTETFFFRAQTQLDELVRLARHHILEPKRKAGMLTLRIWSAGCATGEEAYTLAYLFSRAAPDFTVRVVGTDMNEEALEHGRRGIYPAFSFRTPEAGSLPGLFQITARGHEVVEKQKRRVSFLPLNLVKDAFPAPERGLSAFDVVVCRNVLIYVDADHIPGVMERLAASASPRSLLMVTPAENASAQHATGFSSHGHGLWLRGGASNEAEFQSFKSSSSSSELPSSPQSRAASRPEARSPESTFGAAVSTPARKSARVQVDVLGSRAPGALEDVRKLADGGKLTEALSGASTLISQAPDAPLAYLMRGQILLAANQPRQALKDFKAALFLEPSLAGAELGVAQVLTREHHLDEAAHHFRRVIKLLENRSADEEMPELALDVKTVRRMAEAGAGEGDLP